MQHFPSFTNSIKKASAANISIDAHYKSRVILLKQAVVLD